jgi:DedD protein
VEAKVEAGPAEKKADKPADSVGRFVVQFGAFTDSARAHEARLKVEKTGLKTYAQIAETPDGKKFRVRVGPFDNRSDAEKAAEKIKMIGLPVSILGL